MNFTFSVQKSNFFLHYLNHDFELNFENKGSLSMKRLILEIPEPIPKYIWVCKCNKNK